MKWELIDKEQYRDLLTHRMQVPGGWLVRISSLYEGRGSHPPQSALALTFFPDSNHEWKLSDKEKTTKEESEKKEGSQYQSGSPKCGNCIGKVYGMVMQPFQCESCAQPSVARHSGNWHFCDKCGRQRNACTLCGQPIKKEEGQKVIL